MLRRAPDREAATRWRALPRTALLCALLLANGGAQALPEDRAQPIQISADQALRDEKQGFTVYQGNVRMQQGSLQIAAQRVTVFHQVEEADRILAEGSPAHMQQRPEPDKGLMHARAETIEYFKSEEKVLLRRNASIEREDGSKVTGDSIEYLIDKQQIRANSSQSGGVVVNIPAETVQGKEDADPNQPAEQGETEQEGERGAPDSQ
ncbi:lipopolysaccharide transport periplasmic protein LptA [Parahaliea mediterranea]|uniref:Lipopolysaccharide transport periplasmic protein LptA n=1 Tax=Parahaliea mediterranea TaxID=651086 RepID=A0A939IHE6_9GAMM|nr:lipopolysaccharide transport periplasmic protein LptA [Parahaliea mediterranea]MBN7795344.1 lipopolysaccharide transport periplasmic protein LptA [Parahaliea mediterranea]